MSSQSTAEIPPPPANMPSWSDGIHAVQALERIGAGAFGTVYRAELRSDVVAKSGAALPAGTVVAAKRLALAPNQTEEQLRRLVERDNLLFRFDHPNIVRAYCSFEFQGTDDLPLYILIMEWLDGADGKHIMETYGRLPEDEAVHVMLACARALEHAVQHGVVHRDIKPSNIFRLSDGVTKVLDFGIACTTEGTSTGSGIAGTTGYIAPERYNDPELASGDELADIFSFGVTFYELLTGEMPYWIPGETDEQKAVFASKVWAPNYTERAIPFAHEVFRSRPALRDVVETCLRCDRAKRFDSFADLVTALEECQDSVGSTGDTRANRGRVLGDYRLLERIDVPSKYGHVWIGEPLAAQSDAEARVAIKILADSFCEQRFVDRFRKEAEALEGLDGCPWIVDCLGYLETTNALGEPRYAIVQEYLPHGNLGERLAKRPHGLAPDEAIGVFRCVAEALAYAHDRGLVHRDVKPDNIVPIGSTEAKLIDFGIAHDAGGSRCSEAGLKGTLDYIAPDFLTEGRGFHGDAKSDAYSFGVCFYQALTGQLPYESLWEFGNPQEELRSRALQSSASAIDWSPGVFSNWPELQAICAACLELDRAKRPGRMDEIAQTLGDLLDSLMAVTEFDLVTVGSDGDGRITLGLDSASPPAFRGMLLATEDEFERARLLYRRRRDLGAMIETPLRIMKHGAEPAIAVFGLTSPGAPLASTLTPGDGYWQYAHVVRLLRDTVACLHALHASGLWHGNIGRETVCWCEGTGPCLTQPTFAGSDSPAACQDRDVSDLAALLLRCLCPTTVDVEGLRDCTRRTGVDARFAPPADLTVGETLFACVPEAARILLLMHDRRLTAARASHRLAALCSRPYCGRVVGRFSQSLLGDEAEKRAGYEFLRELDAGGCGKVWEVSRLSDGKAFALKSRHDSHSEKRFRREIEFLKGLGACPSIVQFEDAFVEEDSDGMVRTYLVMERLSGQSLKDLIQAKRQRESTAPVRDILHLFHYYLLALDYCHNRGIIHRDLKPGNLFVEDASDGGIGKLLDFGIARDDRGSTTIADIPGTVEYMAPERWLPSEFGLPRKFRGDPRSDLFELGVCLYESLTGESPFGVPLPASGGDNITFHDAVRERVAGLKQGGVDWFDHTGWPTQLIDFLCGFLHPQPEHRFASAAQARHAIDQLLEQWEELPDAAVRAVDGSLPEMLLPDAAEQASAGKEARSGTNVVVPPTPEYIRTHHEREKRWQTGRRRRKAVPYAAVWLVLLVAGCAWGWHNRGRLSDWFARQSHATGWSACQALTGIEAELRNAEELTTVEYYINRIHRERPSPQEALKWLARRYDEHAQDLTRGLIPNRLERIIQKAPDMVEAGRCIQLADRLWQEEAWRWLGFSEEHTSYLAAVAESRLLTLAALQQSKPGEIITLHDSFFRGLYGPKSDPQEWDVVRFARFEEKTWDAIVKAHANPDLLARLKVAELESAYARIKSRDRGMRATAALNLGARMANVADGVSEEPLMSALGKLTALHTDIINARDEAYIKAADADRYIQAIVGEVKGNGGYVLDVLNEGGFPEFDQLANFEKELAALSADVPSASDAAKWPLWAEKLSDTASGISSLALGRWSTEMQKYSDVLPSENRWVKGKAEEVLRKQFQPDGTFARTLKTVADLGELKKDLDLREFAKYRALVSLEKSLAASPDCHWFGELMRKEVYPELDALAQAALAEAWTGWRRLEFEPRLTPDSIAGMFRGYDLKAATPDEPGAERGPSVPEGLRDYVGAYKQKDTMLEHLTQYWASLQAWTVPEATKRLAEFEKLNDRFVALSQAQELCSDFGKLAALSTLPAHSAALRKIVADRYGELPQLGRMPARFFDLPAGTAASVDAALAKSGKEMFTDVEKLVDSYPPAKTAVTARLSAEYWAALGGWDTSLAQTAREGVKRLDGDATGLVRAEAFATDVASLAAIAVLPEHSKTLKGLFPGLNDGLRQFGRPPPDFFDRFPNIAASIDEALGMDEDAMFRRLAEIEKEYEPIRKAIAVRGKLREFWASLTNWDVSRATKTLDDLKKLHATFAGLGEGRQLATDVSNLSKIVDLPEHSVALRKIAVEDDYAVMRQHWAPPPGFFGAAARIASIADNITAALGEEEGAMFQALDEIVKTYPPMSNALKARRHLSGYWHALGKWDAETAKSALNELLRLNPVFVGKEKAGELASAVGKLGAIDDLPAHSEELRRLTADSDYQKLTPTTSAEGFLSNCSKVAGGIDTALRADAGTLPGLLDGLVETYPPSQKAVASRRVLSGYWTALRQWDADAAKDALADFRKRNPRLASVSDDAAKLLAEVNTLNTIGDLPGHAKKLREFSLASYPQLQHQGAPPTDFIAQFGAQADAVDAALKVEGPTMFDELGKLIKAYPLARSAATTLMNSWCFVSWDWDDDVSDAQKALDQLSVVLSSAGPGSVPNANPARGAQVRLGTGRGYRLAVSASEREPYSREFTPRSGQRFLPLSVPALQPRLGPPPEELQRQSRQADRDIMAAIDAVFVHDHFQGAELKSTGWQRNGPPFKPASWRSPTLPNGITDTAAATLEKTIGREQVTWLQAFNAPLGRAAASELVRKLESLRFPDTDAGKAARLRCAYALCVLKWSGPDLIPEANAYAFETMEGCLDRLPQTMRMSELEAALGNHPPLLRFVMYCNLRERSVWRDHEYRLLLLSAMDRDPGFDLSGLDRKVLDLARRKLTRSGESAITSEAIYLRLRGVTRDLTPFERAVMEYYGRQRTATEVARTGGGGGV